MLLPIVGGNNLFKFIISAIFQQERSPQCHTQERGVCVCVHLYMYCTMYVRLTSMRINPSPRFYGNALSAEWV